MAIAQAMRSPNRRRLVVALALAASLQSVPGGVFSQPVRRIAYFAVNQRPGHPQSPVWLRDRLKVLGFEEGRNLVLERRWATSENADAMARELVARGVEVIVTFSNSATEAALRATRTTPIVIAWGLDPLGAGFVQSLSRPGGNVTGNAFYTTDTNAKNFELMLEAFPKARRAAWLSLGWSNFDRGWYRSATTRRKQIAAERHIAFQTFDLDRREDVRDTLSAIESASLDMLFVSSDPADMGLEPVVAKFALKARIPTMSPMDHWVDVGGLFYFGPDQEEVLDRTPRYVAQLLRGAKAAELPMEQPSRYHLSINLKTARALGFAVPSALLVRADRIVE